MLDHPVETARAAIRAAHLRADADALADLAQGTGLDPALRARIHDRATDLVRRIRSDARPSMMELFLGEYGLSTDEGVALMCLAEALLRVPDAETMDALIEDKIAASEWGAHLGHSHSPLVNASTWALFMTGHVLREGEGVARTLRGAIRRLGEPVIRQAVGRAMREMGRQFVLGETIEAAMTRAARMEAKGYTYSYDMLGEAARTFADARRYHMAYAHAIAELAQKAQGDVRDVPGISIKLSALHPRYETLQRARVMRELLPRAKTLAALAKSAGIGLNIDAEEANRLDLSLDLVEALASDPDLADWDGLGVVVQAYGTRAGRVIDWLYALAGREGRRLMVRLVKGAYWDTEVKAAQVQGLTGFPVFTTKAATDASFLYCAEKLLAMTDRIYPQFATHNAHTVAAILEMAGNESGFEFQRLHGMGEALHDTVLQRHSTRCRIYAPVGAHKDLLAYLVRRLLENGANSSFVNQLVDTDVPPHVVAADPFAALGKPSPLTWPADLFPGRRNSRGWDLGEPSVVADLADAMAPHADTAYGGPALSGAAMPIANPATGAPVGEVRAATAADVDAAADRARPWSVPVAERAEALRAAADLYEAHHAEIFALLAREAGKTILDSVAELREAVDFLRYYAAEAEAADPGGQGVWTCISPWNFPLAIFTGQIAAALAAGNAVLAKPAEATPLIAAYAVDLMHRAGVPQTALQLLPGPGAETGAALTADARVTGVAFTGSTATARAIRGAMAGAMDPGAPLIAETGGLNAMIVDSTALPEQAVRDIVGSAFQSAGQRCSALRCLYVQEDVADQITGMLFGAMDALVVGDPWRMDTDVGPVIDAAAKAGIDAHIDRARAEGRLLKQIAAPSQGTFVGPAVLSVPGIGALEEEIFGPVLHLATFRAEDLDTVVAAINATGYGLTFGLHTRIDDRVQDVTDAIAVGNAYVNRNQIGAVVGSQPFGGEGLSGTGPKAGGPHYVPRFGARDIPGLTAAMGDAMVARPAAGGEVLDLPGPTGEMNRLTVLPRPGATLLLGPGDAALEAQAEAARAAGFAVTDWSGGTDPDNVAGVADLAAVVLWSDAPTARPYAQALAERPGPIVPLLTDRTFARWLHIERHVCVDTTAAGGNAALLAGAQP